ncbi:unnamed protein product [Polarella glacialis]|uniref:Uncharacterized protein n=1 Tax=Polarella glacialis TaxID=89957 RepID=A0A813FNB8_POLGL|nr:unnamed protein product [Polarella glacialis]
MAVTTQLGSYSQGEGASAAGTGSKVTPSRSRTDGGNSIAPERAHELPYLTTASVRSARRSVTWILEFILVLCITGPVYAASAKCEVYTSVIGTPLSVLRQWIFTCGKIGLTIMCYKAVTSVNEPIGACLHCTIAGLVSKGSLAASISKANCLAISKALYHDMSCRLIDNKELQPPGLQTSRACWPGPFSLAASGNFPALCRDIGWRRTNAQSAMAGLTLAYLLSTRQGGWVLLGRHLRCRDSCVQPQGDFAVNIFVSLLTQPPADNVLAMIDSLRDLKVTSKDLTAEELGSMCVTLESLLTRDKRNLCTFTFEKEVNAAVNADRGVQGPLHFDPKAVVFVLRSAKYAIERLAQVGQTERFGLDLTRAPQILGTDRSPNGCGSPELKWNVEKWRLLLKSRCVYSKSFALQTREYLLTKEKEGSPIAIGGCEELVPGELKMMKSSRLHAMSAEAAQAQAFAANSRLAKMGGGKFQ